MTISHIADSLPSLPDDATACSLYDAATQTTLVVGTPASAPGVWMNYIDGAIETYRSHGIAHAIDVTSVRDGVGTRLFCAVLDYDGHVVGGLRIRGPYRSPDDSHALLEWAGQRGQPALVRAIRSRIPGGLVEAKTAYAVSNNPAGRHVAARLTRMPMIVMSLTECRYVMATSAEHVLSRWQSGGGCIDTTIETTPYPDERYTTAAMFWDWNTLQHHAEPTVWDQMQSEYAQFESTRHMTMATAM